MPSSLKNLPSRIWWGPALSGMVVAGLTCSPAESIPGPLGPDPIFHRLTVVGAGAGTGSVSSTPPGITCTISNGQASGSCTADFEENVSVVLMGTASAGSQHLGWTGACTGTSCTVSMTEPLEASAHFEPEEAPQPTIGLSTTTLTFTSEEGSNPDPQSQTVTVTNAGPGSLSWGRSSNEPWMIAGVSGSPRALASGESQAIDVRVESASLAAGAYTGTLTVTAPGATNDPQTVQVSLTVAEPPPKQLTVEGAGTGSGTVTSDPSGVTCDISNGSESGACSADFSHGTSVRLTAAALAGSSFQGWSGPCSGTGTCQVTMDQARAVTAEFDLVPLATPAIVFLETTPGSAGFINHWFEVTNRASYDDALFAAAPHLPPCGANTNASRTWVDFEDDDDNRLNRFCALSEAADLERLSFAWPVGSLPPSPVTLVLNDRETGQTEESNGAVIPRLVTPVLAYDSAGVETTGVRHYLSVTNRSEFDSSLFAAASHLPPCGLNNDASRTWLTILSGSQQLNVFCALTDSDGLEGFWFFVTTGAPTPGQVLIELEDRQTGQKVSSNNVTVP